MKSSRITVPVLAGILAVAGLLVTGVSFQLGSLTSLLGYCTAATVAVLVATDYRLTSRRPTPVSK